MSEFVVVAGARPNFMKVAPILREVATRGIGVKATLVHTGQHYDPVMSDVFFEQLGIPAPDVHLQVGSGTHGTQTAKIILAFEEYLLTRSPPPSWVIVVGDVNSTMACTLVAVKLGIPVAHVEAGLRSGDRDMPEEINRMVTDSIADLLLVSEPDGLANLEREGVSKDRIAYVGNVMIDTLAHQLEQARELDNLEQLGLSSNGYGLVTLHRPSNVDSGDQLAALVGVLIRISTRIPIVFPVHPRTAAKLDEFDLRETLEDNENVRLLPPLGYRENLNLMANAKVVISDSGGIQEETSYLGVPCITLRPNTERPVTITRGTNTLIDGDAAAAIPVVDQIMSGEYKKGNDIEGWDGNAAKRIVNILLAR